MDEAVKIVNDIKAGNIKPIYFLMGEEPYFIDKVSDYIEKNIYPFLIDNGWEHFFYLSDKEFDLQDILKLFPIIEN